MSSTWIVATTLPVAGIELTLPPIILCIAGSDPVMGAGLQMDERICHLLGCEFFGIPAVDTVQSSYGLQAVYPKEADAVVANMRVALLSGRVKAVKTGALGNARVVRAVAKFLLGHPELPLIVDPIGKATLSVSTDVRLLTKRGERVLKEDLFPLASLVTPNQSEYGAGEDYADISAVLLTGGHAEKAGSLVEDILLRPEQADVLYTHPRVEGFTAVHGTGCALSTAIACRLALGDSLEEACGVGARLPGLVGR
jgi:hydroxymethylpyrimidine/phosphomethylpyrimidine kinase